jgi:hypothetical protein
MCPIENAYTNLGQPRIIDLIHRICTGLGLKTDPPLLFESKINDTWTQLSNKHYIQLTATVCYLHVNHKTIRTASIVVNKELFTFAVAAVRPFFNHTSKHASFADEPDSPIRGNPSFIATKPTACRSASASIATAGTPSRTWSFPQRITEHRDRRRPGSSTAGHRCRSETSTDGRSCTCPPDRPANSWMC